MFEIRNGTGDRAFSATAQLEKRFAGGTELSVAYTWTSAKDRMSPAGDVPGPNVASTPLNGALDRRDLRTSLWERPHKVTLVGTADLPLGFRLGLIYLGMSSAPYTYVVEGDANADGFWPDFARRTMSCTCRRTPPTSPWPNRREYAELESLIRDEPCLRTSGAAC